MEEERRAMELDSTQESIPEWLERGSRSGVVGNRGKVTSGERLAMTDAIWLQDSNSVPLKVYRKPIVPGCNTFELLGAVRKHTHKSYEWWRWESKFFPAWIGGHGFEKNAQKAMRKVREGFHRERKGAKP